MQPVYGCRRPLRVSADTPIPILLSLHVVLAASPTMSGTACVGAEAGRTPGAASGRSVTNALGGG